MRWTHYSLPLSPSRHLPANHSTWGRGLSRLGKGARLTAEPARERGRWPPDPGDTGGGALERLNALIAQ